MVGLAVVVVLVAVVIGSAGSKSKDASRTTTNSAHKRNVASSTTAPTHTTAPATTTTTAPLNVTTVTVKKLPKTPLFDTPANATVNAQHACDWQVAVEKLALSSGKRGNGFAGEAVGYMEEVWTFAASAAANVNTYDQLATAATVQEHWGDSAAAHWTTPTNMITATQVTNVDGACEALGLQ